MGLQNLTLAVGFVSNPTVLLVTDVTSSTVGLACASSSCLGVIQLLTGSEEKEVNYKLHRIASTTKVIFKPDTLYST
jgi:hypothetical protein